MAIGIPSMLESLVTTFTAIIDSKMVSSFGITAIAAVSVTNQPRLLALSIFFAINTVTSSLVAKYLGENNRDAANEIFVAVIKVVIVLSILISVMLVIFAKPILIAFANQPDTLNDSVIYFQIVMGGMIFNTIDMAIDATFIGCGKTNITFLSNLISCTVNVIFNYLLIEGRCGFPALGVKGAAIATVIGYFVAMAYCITRIFNKKNYINIQYCAEHKFRTSKESYGEINRLSKNAFVERLSSRLSLFIIGAIVARIGSFQMAVYAICIHLMNINFALGTGVQTAGVALIGRSYGSKDIEAIKTYKDAIVKVTIISSIIFALTIILSRGWYVGLFSKEEVFIKMGEISCIIVGLITIFQSLKFAYVGCLIGLGDMKAVMYASIFSFSMINIVLLVIIILIFKRGVYGVWIASLVAQIIQCLMAYRFVNRDIISLSEVKD